MLLVGYLKAVSWGLLYLFIINDLPSVTVCPKTIFLDDTKADNDIRGNNDKMMLQNSIDTIVNWSF